MRLLHSTTFELKEFIGKQVPPYVILSHTWGDEEVSIQDMFGGRRDDKPGYDKVKHCCELAASDGFDYVWIDTCCIDKTSSAELSEAINSMYQWYEHAEVCYVYLSDVPYSADPRGHGSCFSKSRWFTRGWTLQELIAPSNLIFFSKEWKEIGTKSYLQGIISEITGINLTILSGGEVESVSIAQRMSWASRRKTTRLEDRAYCLMGIFGVNMPMLYGEGDKAFTRLQEEIMKISDDHTIFAWKLNTWWDHDGGLLAPSPAAFINSGNFIRSSQTNGSAPFTVTNKGLHLELALKVLGDAKTYLAILNCQEFGKEDQLLGVRLRDISESGEIFVRDRPDQIEMIDESERTGIFPRTVYVRQGRPSRQSNAASYRHCFIKIAGAKEHGFSLHEIYPSQPWIRSDGTVTSMIPAYDDIFGALSFRDNRGNNFVVMLKRKGTLISVNVVAQIGSETLKEVFWSFDKNISESKAGRREWVDEPDRIFRARNTVTYNPQYRYNPQSAYPYEDSSHGWIIVGIRRQIMSEQKHIVVDISCENSVFLYTD